MTVVLKDLEKRYRDGTLAVSGLNLEIGQGEFFTLLGPSGCGKTTTLRMIAGLETPTSGSISIDGRDVTRDDPGDRDVAMVFQSYALYPHMTVHDNMALNLQVARVPRSEIENRVLDTARMLGLESLLDKKPGKLSGGQRQRVALGRAIIRQPSLFLLDEPLSNLDLKLREQMRTELKRLHQKLAITTVYVTHDQTESLVLSDRIAVMGHGEVQQIGTPTEIYDNPVNLFVAEFIGSPSINLLRARSAGGGVYLGQHRVLSASLSLSEGLIVGARSEAVQVVTPGDGILDGVVELVEPIGAIAFVFVRLDQEGILHRRDLLVVGMEAHGCPSAGTRVGLRFREGRLRLFDSNGLAVPHGQFQPPTSTA